MQLQKERDTTPEMTLRRTLHRRGLRYRVDLPAIPGKRRRIDIAFTRQKLAIFVDGCFWHGCPEHGQRNHIINAWYWPHKIAGNKQRDAETTRLLESLGWTVLRYWEHDDMVAVADAICSTKQKLSD